MCNSYNIFGASSKIGIEFYKLVQQTSTIDCFCTPKSVEKLKSKIKTPIHIIDFSSLKWVNELQIPNHEALLYLVGKHHFSKNLLNFSEEDLETLFYLDLMSLFALIKKLLKLKNSNLKKIVIINSIIPEEINTIYHLTKMLQIKMLKSLAPIFENKKISLSILYCSWINTKMLKEYKQKYSIEEINSFEPKFVAKKCLNEFYSKKTGIHYITIKYENI